MLGLSVEGPSTPWTRERSASQWVASAVMPGIRPHNFVGRVMAFVQPGTNKDDVAVDLHASLFFGVLKILRVDVAQIRDVSQIQADGLAHEHVERHLIDGRAAALGVTKRVDVGTDMVHHAR